jgi:hypothetical protein
VKVTKAENAAPKPRKHHYVPQLYLRGFTDQKGQLFAVNAHDRKTFMTPPGNICAERDFNKIDVEGIPEDALEKEFARWEGWAAPFIERVRAEAKFPDAEHREAVVSLIVALAVRNPRKREAFQPFLTDIVINMLIMSFETKERWEATVASMKAGDAWPKDAPADFDGHKKYVEENAGKLRATQQMQLDLELDQLTHTYPYFDARRYRFLKAKDDAGTFATTDHPVCLRRPNDIDRGKTFLAGYTISATEVLFPLSPKLAIIGRLDGKEDTVDVDKYEVARLNAIIMGYAMRQVYATDDQFYYTRPNPQPLGRGYELAEDPIFDVREEQ